MLWLVSKNRLKDAEKVVAKMAARNKRELPIDLSKNLKELSKVSVTFSSYFSLGEGKGWMAIIAFDTLYTFSLK